MTASHRRISTHDRFTSVLVLILVVAMIVTGGVLLYATGIFAPVEAKVSLDDTLPLPITTLAPSGGLFDWLFASASAEETNEGETATDLDELLAEIIASEQEEEISEEDRVAVDQRDLAVNPNLPNDWFNILLMATDSRFAAQPSSRTDVMIVCSVNAVTGEVKLASLARDLYTQIPGGRQTRINNAYAYGGPLLAVKTVNKNFELNIKQYAVVNFQGMAAIVDALGGVDIPLAGLEYQYINYNVAVSEDYEGFPKSSARRVLTEEDVDATVHLDGLQAVSYARIRKLDNDIQRGSRQRVLLQAIMDKGLSMATPSTLVNMAMSIVPNTVTNMPITTILQIGLDFLAAGDVSLSELSIPVTGSWHNAVEDEMSVISYNQMQNTKALHEFIYGEYIPAVAPEK